MRKTKSTILEAVHDTAKGLHKAGVTDHLTNDQKATKQHTKRRAVLDELVKEAQALNMGY